MVKKIKINKCWLDHGRTDSCVLACLANLVVVSNELFHCQQTESDTFYFHCFWPTFDKLKRSTALNHWQLSLHFCLLLPSQAIICVFSPKSCLTAVSKIRLNSIDPTLGKSFHSLFCDKYVHKEPIRVTALLYICVTFDPSGSFTLQGPVTQMFIVNVSKSKAVWNRNTHVQMTRYLCRIIRLGFCKAFHDAHSISNNSTNHLLLL